MEKCKQCKKRERREGSLFCSHECKIKWLEEAELEAKKLREKVPTKK